MPVGIVHEGYDKEIHEFVHLQKSKNSIIK